MGKTVISMIEAQLKDFVEAIRPEDEDVRKKLDIGYSWDGATAVFYQIRPAWNDPSTIRHHDFAKIRYIKAEQVWKLYWLHASRRWESYKWLPEHPQLERVFDEIGEDPNHCFFG